MATQMEPYLMALVFYKNRKYEECTDLCTKILNREPHDQVNSVNSVIIIGCAVQYIFPMFL